MYLCIVSLLGKETPSIQGVRVRRCLCTANSGRSISSSVYEGLRMIMWPGWSREKLTQWALSEVGLKAMTMNGIAVHWHDYAMIAHRAESLCCLLSIGPNCLQTLRTA